MPVSILHIVADGAPGGGTTVVLGLCEDLINSGKWNVTLITQPDSYAFHQANKLGTNVFPFDFFSSRFDRRIGMRLFSLIGAIKPDLIHVHGARAAFPFCSGPLKSLSCPLVYTVHGYHFRHKQGLTKWLGWYAERQISGRCDHLTWVSRGDALVAHRWRLLACELNNTTVVYNGIDPALFDGVKPQTEQYDLVFVGRLEEPKNPLFMVDIVARLKSRNVSLLLVGGGSLEKQLHDYAKRLNVDHLITFTGALPNLDTLQAIRSARIAILPSLWEGLPVLPLEAGYLGVPVVATDISGVDEIIVDGKNGYLISGHDPEKFAEAIRFLLDSPTVATEMGIQARQMVEENFLRQSSSSQYIDIYRSLIKENG